MSYLYNGDAILKGNLTIDSDKPLDSGSIVKNKSDLTTLSSNLYNGKLVISLDNESIYILKDKTKVSDLEKGWVKVATVTRYEGDLPSNLEELIFDAVLLEFSGLDDKVADIIEGLLINVLTDDLVTENSSNPVKSSGIFKALLLTESRVVDIANLAIEDAIEESLPEKVDKAVEGIEDRLNDTIDKSITDKVPTIVEDKISEAEERINDSIKLEIDKAIGDNISEVVTEVVGDTINTTVNNIIDSKTDNTVTENSSNLVKSSGIYTAINLGIQSAKDYTDNTISGIDDKVIQLVELKVPDIGNDIKLEVVESISETINNSIDQVLDKKIDDTVIENSENLVKSSGIFTAINLKVDSKFIVLTETEYNRLFPKDSNTFYFIKK